MARIEDIPLGTREAVVGLACPEPASFPWVRPRPLAQSRIAILTSAALHRRSEMPFPAGTAEFRELPSSLPLPSVAVVAAVVVAVPAVPAVVAEPPLLSLLVALPIVVFAVVPLPSLESPASPSSGSLAQAAAPPSAQASVRDRA